MPAPGPCPGPGLCMGCRSCKLQRASSASFLEAMEDHRTKKVRKPSPRLAEQLATKDTSGETSSLEQQKRRKKSERTGGSRGQSSGEPSKKRRRESSLTEPEGEPRPLLTSTAKPGSNLPGTEQMEEVFEEEAETREAGENKISLSVLVASLETTSTGLPATRSWEELETISRSEIPTLPINARPEPESAWPVLEAGIRVTGEGPTVPDQQEVDHRQEVQPEQLLPTPPSSGVESSHSATTGGDGDMADPSESVDSLDSVQSRPADGGRGSASSESETFLHPNGPGRYDSGESAWVGVGVWSPVEPEELDWEQMGRASPKWDRWRYNYPCSPLPRPFVTIQGLVVQDWEPDHEVLEDSYRLGPVLPSERLEIVERHFRQRTTARDGAKEKWLSWRVRAEEMEKVTKTEVLDAFRQRDHSASYWEQEEILALIKAWVEFNNWKTDSLLHNTIFAGPRLDSRRRFYPFQEEVAGQGLVHRIYSIKLSLEIRTREPPRVAQSSGSSNEDQKGEMGKCPGEKGKCPGEKGEVKSSPKGGGRLVTSPVGRGALLAEQNLTKRTRPEHKRLLLKPVYITEGYSELSPDNLPTDSNDERLYWQRAEDRRRYRSFSQGAREMRCRTEEVRSAEEGDPCPGLQKLQRLKVQGRALFPHAPLSHARLVNYPRKGNTRSYFTPLPGKVIQPRRRLKFGNNKWESAPETVGAEDKKQQDEQAEKVEEKADEVDGADGRPGYWGAAQMETEAEDQAEPPAGVGDGAGDAPGVADLPRQQNPSELDAAAGGGSALPAAPTDEVSEISEAARRAPMQGGASLGAIPKHPARLSCRTGAGQGLDQINSPPRPKPTVSFVIESPQGGAGSSASAGRRPESTAQPAVPYWWELSTDNPKWIRYMEQELKASIVNHSECLQVLETLSWSIEKSVEVPVTTFARVAAALAGLVINIQSEKEGNPSLQAVDRVDLSPLLVSSVALVKHEQRQLTRLLLGGDEEPGSKDRPNLDWFGREDGKLAYAMNVSVMEPRLVSKIGCFSEALQHTYLALWQKCEAMDWSGEEEKRDLVMRAISGLEIIVDLASNFGEEFNRLVCHYIFFAMNSRGQEIDDTVVEEMETSFSTLAASSLSPSRQSDRLKLYSTARKRLFVSMRELGSSLAGSAAEALTLLDRVKEILEYSRSRVGLVFAQENALRNLLETVRQERPGHDGRLMDDVGRARRRYGAPYHLPCTDATIDRLRQILQALQVTPWEDEAMEAESGGEEDVDGNSISKLQRRGSEEERALLLPNMEEGESGIETNTIIVESLPALPSLVLSQMWICPEHQGEKKTDSQGSGVKPARPAPNLIDSIPPQPDSAAPVLTPDKSAGEIAANMLESQRRVDSLKEYNQQQWRLTAVSTETRNVIARVLNKVNEDNDKKAALKGSESPGDKRHKGN